MPRHHHQLLRSQDDDASNAKVVEMIKSNKDWHDNISGHKPVKVRVVAMPNGDYMVIKEIK